jgi:predicted alpha/beta hydrolase family esterase
MKKVFIVHGFEGMPNGGWRPWLMAELEKLGVYACALSMPTPEKPVEAEWVAEISRHIPTESPDEYYLVGHSLGTPAILRYLENANPKIRLKGAVLTASPLDNVGVEGISDFFKTSFDFETIKQRAACFAVIHGDNDDVVPLGHAKTLAGELDANLVIVPEGGHLTGSDGWYQLPQVLEALRRIF